MTGFLFSVVVRWGRTTVGFDKGLPFLFHALAPDQIEHKGSIKLVTFAQLRKREV